MRTPAGRTILSALMLCGLALAAPLAAADGGGGRLEVVDSRGDTLISIDMPEGEGWCLAWNHSVKGFQVLDCYRHVEGRMVLERSHQPDFAAGLGHFEGRGVQVSDGEGGYWIEAINEPVPGNRYALRVGSPRVDHRLRWQRDGQAHRLSLSSRMAGQRVFLQLNMNRLGD